MNSCCQENGGDSTMNGPQYTSVCSITTRQPAQEAIHICCCRLIERYLLSTYHSVNQPSELLKPFEVGVVKPRGKLTQRKIVEKRFKIIVT